MNERAVFEAISRGEITRREAAEQLGLYELSFGDMLLRLHEYGLKLPRFKVDPDAPGVRLMVRLARSGLREDGPPAKVLVMDTGPLITLAAADSLGYLLYPAIPVYLPDAVFYEATNKAGALGAGGVIDWAQENVGRVIQVATDVFIGSEALRLSRPDIKQKNVGERAAVEVAQYALKLDDSGTTGVAVLLTEDDRMLKGNFYIVEEDRHRIIPLSTIEFLTALEIAGRINSVEEVYQRAEDAGRLASRRQAAREAHERGMKAVAAVMARQKKILRTL